MKNEPLKTRYIAMKCGVVCVLVLLFAHAAWGQAEGEAATPAFEDYVFSQYIQCPGPCPANILDLDNNGEIALAAREGATRAQLEAAGIHFVESQIELLKTWRLMVEEDDTLKTAFPILGPEKTRALRSRVRSVVPALVETLAPEIRRFVGELGRTGREENAYTILFSYVFDGLVWRDLEARGVLDAHELTAETPLWSGEVWALYPPRPFASGTNSITDEGVSLKVNWTRAALHAMRPFVADFPTLMRMFDDYREKGYVEDERARRVFGPFDLFDETGHFTIPVIVETEGNPLYGSAQTIAGQAAEKAPGLLRLPELVEAFGFRDAKQALVVAYHELMWDIMDRLETDGLVKKPTAFAEPKRAEPADIAALVFIVRDEE